MAEGYILVLTRWIHFSAAMALFGSSLSPFYIGRNWQLASAPTRPFTLLLGGLAFANASLWLFGYASDIGEPEPVATTIWVILTETSFGIIWIVRLAAAALVVCVSFLVSGRSRSGLIVALAAMLLVAEGWDGHVVGAPNFGPVNQAIHLLAAGFWLGGLIPLGRTVTQARCGTVLDMRHAARALRRFSNLALVAVSLVALTGVVNVWLVLGAAPNPLAPYGRALVVKIALFCCMLVLASLNRFVTMRSLTNSTKERQAFSRLSVTIILEQLIGAVILLDVSALGLMDPVG